MQKDLKGCDKGGFIVPPKFRLSKIIPCTKKMMPVIGRYLNECQCKMTTTSSPTNHHLKIYGTKDCTKGF